MNKADCPDPVVLPEGAEICVRPLEPGEERVVAEVFDALGERSRRERFHGPKARLGRDELARMASVDHRDREALVAVDMSSDRPLAIFELVRDSQDAAVAEVAFAVADDWHGRGVGRALAERLAARARRLCLDRLRGYVVASNDRAFAVLRRMGHVVGSRFEGGSYEVEIALDGEE
jgi:acetyltransferase